MQAVTGLKLLNLATKAYVIAIWVVGIMVQNLLVIMLCLKLCAGEVVVVVIKRE